MKDTKTDICNRIICKMASSLNSIQREELREAIVAVLQDVDVTERETALATTDTTNEYLLDLFKTIKGERLSAKTMKFYIYTLNKLADATHRNFTQMTSLDVEYFLMGLKKNGNSATTLNNHLRNISAFYRWLVNQRIVTFNPCSAIEPFKEIEKPIDFLTVAEFDRLRSSCKDTRERCLIELLRCTALRAEEIPFLQIEHIDFQNCSILAYLPKQKKYRTVFFDKLTLGYLLEYIGDRKTGAVIMSKRSQKALSPDAINSMLKRIGQRSGLHRNIYIHLLRRTCATNIVERGGSIEEAGVYLGHKQKSVTGKFYAAYGNEYIKRIFDRYVAAA